MSFWIHSSGEDLADASIRLVVVTLASLVLHDIALCVELCEIQGVEQEAHAVGFQPKRGLQIVRRNVLEIVGSIIGGGTVVITAHTFRQFVMQTVRNMTRTSEHHVLEEMRKTSTPRHFIL